MMAISDISKEIGVFFVLVAGNVQQHKYENM
jgi:hypothetical protein